MSYENLAVERAMWAVLIRSCLKDKFSLREFLTVYSTTFMVSSKDSPDWSAKLAVCSAHNGRNRVELDGKVLSYAFSSPIREKLAGILTEHRERYMAALTRAKRNELAAQMWSAREQEELKDLPEFNAMSTTIIRSGPYAGQYTVAFSAGHPLEHLTLEQVKAFHQFVQSLSSKLT